MDDNWEAQMLDDYIKRHGHAPVTHTHEERKAIFLAERELDNMANKDTAIALRQYALSTKLTKDDHCESLKNFFLVFNEIGAEMVISGRVQNFSRYWKPPNLAFQTDVTGKC